MQQCCTAVACNGAALRQGVVTGSTADSDDASSTIQRFVNALASAPVILRSDASKAGTVKALTQTDRRRLDLLHAIRWALSPVLLHGA